MQREINDEKAISGSKIKSSAHSILGSENIAKPHFYANLNNRKQLLT